MVSQSVSKSVSQSVRVSHSVSQSVSGSPHPCNFQKIKAMIVKDRRICSKCENLSFDTSREMTKIKKVIEVIVKQGEGHHVGKVVEWGGKVRIG